MHKNSFFIFNLFYQHLFCAVLLLLSFLEIQIKLFRKSSLISWENIFKFLLTSALILVIILRQFAWRCISDAVICGFDYMNRCRNSHCIKSEDSIINMQVWRNWQTRMVQVHVNASSCRFKSCYPHHEKSPFRRRRKGLFSNEAHLAVHEKWRRCANEKWFPETQAFPSASLHTRVARASWRHGRRFMFAQQTLH